LSEAEKKFLEKASQLSPPVQLTSNLSEAERQFLVRPQRDQAKEGDLARRKETVRTIQNDWHESINKDAYLEYTTPGTEESIFNRPWASFKDPIPALLAHPAHPARPMGRPTPGSFLSNMLSGLSQHGNVMEFAEPPRALPSPPASDVDRPSIMRDEEDDLMSFSSSELDPYSTPSVPPRSKKRDAILVKPSTKGKTASAAHSFMSSLETITPTTIRHSYTNDNEAPQPFPQYDDSQFYEEEEYREDYSDASGDLELARRLQERLWTDDTDNGRTMSEDPEGKRKSDPTASEEERDGRRNPSKKRRSVPSYGHEDNTPRQSQYFRSSYSGSSRSDTTPRQSHYQSRSPHLWRTQRSYRPDCAARESSKAVIERA